MKTEFSLHISKNFHIPNFIKIRPVVAELFLADGRRDWQTEGGRTGPTEVIVAFRNFAQSA